MYVSAAPIFESTNFCRFSPSRPNSTASTPSNKNPSRNGAHSSILFLKIQSWRCSSIAKSGGGGALQISARFGPPSRRRNSLREKLLPSTVEQVRRVPETLYPDPDPDLELSEDFGCELEDFTTNAGANSNNEVVEDVGRGSDNSSEKKSLLCDKLESWVDQYKADSEFWGVGAGPIFRIYQDSDRKIVRVIVNEDEIIKRSRIQTLPLEMKGEVEESTDVNFKIGRAKLIARMIESGEYALPKNSSVVKFVYEEKKSSFVEGLRSVSIQPFLKMFPRTGFMLLCGCCVLWAVVKLFMQNGNVELSREEAEMLRRKIKLRMEREELEKGSVKVLDDVPELPVGSRPQLDRNELMRNIEQAMSKVTTDPSSASSHLTAKTRDVEDKIKEIRKMVRKVREQERQDSSETESENSNRTEIHSILRVKKKKNIINKNNSGLETEATDEASHVDRKDKEMLQNSSTELTDDTSYKESPNSLHNNGNSMDEEGHHKGEATSCSSGAQSIGVDAENVVNYDAISSRDILTNRGKLGKNELLHSSVAEERIDSSSSSDVSSRNTYRMKQRIITSVEEAREYLAQRHGMPSDTAKSDKEMQVEERSTGVNAWSHCNDNKAMESTSLRNSEGMCMVETSDKLQGETSSGDLYGDEFIAASRQKIPSIDDYSITKLNADDADNNKLSVDMENSEMQGEKNFNILSDDSDQIFATHNSINGSPDLSVLETGTKSKSTTRYLEAVNTTDLQNDSSTVEIKNLNEKQKDVQDQRNQCILNTSGNDLELENPATSSCHGVKSLAVDPSKEDTVSQSQELDILNCENKLSLEPQGPQDESDNWDSSNRDDSYVNTDSGVIAEHMMVGTSKKDHSKDFTLSAFDTALQSMAEKQDSYVTGVSLCRELETSKDPFDSDEVGRLSDGKQQNAEKSWVEENFQELDPVITEIGVGFKESYMAAKEKVQQQPSLNTDLSDLITIEGDDELQWMNDENLKRIVFQVQDNELAGRDPFHSLDADDKRAFFKGLENKAEKLNGKLLRLHEWVHSRIENLDYGRDSISLYDPLEKIIPHWKDPSIDEDPDFQYRKPIFSKEDVTEDNLQEIKELTDSEGVSPDSPINAIRKMSLDASSVKPKTLIEGSDGNIRPGKKKGKEHWQHTKKWTQGFLEVYNAETDPEIKSIMRDMGKDLDKWITDKDTQDVADLMTKLPKRKRKYIEKKLEKIKRKVEMLGAPAVVSKYREYSDEKEEDYLWWLDLSFVLCIELYTIEEGTPKMGFYSLEMAADLESSPKQYHVIAFEDPGDSKNFCYIIQAHMDMLRSGKAFVVARPPKDAFREAKANGFNVTVIRKGQIKLNVYQTLEEVEEEIKEIGSKIYHDKIMLDAHTLPKGVIAADKSVKRRSNQTQTKSTKSRKSTKPAKS